MVMSLHARNLTNFKILRKRSFLHSHFINLHVNAEKQVSLKNKIDDFLATVAVQTLFTDANNRATLFTPHDFIAATFSLL